MYDDQWPKWLYRPDGTGEIFQRPEDVPAGDWAETPNRFNGADLTKFDGNDSWVFRDGTPVSPISDATVRMMRGMAARGLLGRK